jgi:hypothetical protein
MKKEIKMFCSAYMSQPLEQDFGIQKSPIYTEGNPLAWVNISVLERRIDEFELVGRLRGSVLIKDMLPLSLELYAALNKVSCLVADKLAYSTEVSVLESRFNGLSGLLIFITSLISSINYGNSPHSLLK